MERPSHDELISAYFDGEATPEERALVERLLADPKHRQTLEEYGQLRDEIRSMPTPRLSSAWSVRLREKLAEAKPTWAAPVAAPHRAAAAATAPPFSTDGKVEAPPVVPLARPGSSGDGYFRFRQLWLAAGVGVAAGTLGIVIGWSAQTLRPDGSNADVAFGEGYETQSAAPAEPMAAMPSTDFAIRDGEEDATFAKADPAAAEAQSFRHRSGEAPAPTGFEAAIADAPADYAENAGIAAYDDSVAKSGVAEGLDNDRVARLGESELKKAEKQTEALTEGAPSVRMGDETLDVASGAVASWRDDADGMMVDGKRGDFFATYVGVWERPVFDAYDASGGDPDLKFQAAGQQIGRKSESGEAVLGETSETPSLSLEGTPEKVAEALEILSRAETGGRVRLLTRVDEDGLSRTERLQRLSDLASAPAELSAESALRLELESVDQRVEEREDRSANGLADGVAVDKLAAAETASGIARIEAFFHQDESGKDRQLAEGLAGKESFGAYGFGSGASPGSAGASGFGGAAAGGAGLGGGGLGGGTFTESAQTERAEMDAAGPFAAPAAEAPRSNSLADISNGEFRGGAESPGPAPLASRAMQPATRPTPVPPPAPAPATALAETVPGLPLPDAPNAPPAGEPNSRIWNVAPAGNGDAAAGAFGPRAPMIAGTPTPPAPSASAPAGVVAGSDSGTRRAKSNDETTNAPEAATPLTLSQSEPADPEGAAPMPPAEKPASDPATVESMSLLSQEQQQLVLERELLDRAREMNLQAGGARYARGFAAPAPQRVRVILYPPSALARSEAELAMPAGSSSGSAAAPAGPVTSPAQPAAQPAADAGPAEAAPAAPDR